MPKVSKEAKWIMCKKCGSTAVFTPYHLTTFCVYCMVVFDPSATGTLLLMGPATLSEGAPNAS